MINRFSAVLNLINALRINDGCKKISKCDVLLFCHDNDRGLSLQGLAYSPILDSIQEEFNLRGLKTQVIAHPWSKLTGKKAFSEPVCINRSYFIAKIAKKFFKLDWDVRLYKKIYLSSNPDLIVTIGCSDALCLAAHELGIKHVELLHGMGYDPLPWGWDRKDKIHLPQEIWAFDDVSVRTFSTLEKKGIKIKQISHPFLSRFDEDRISDLPDEWQPRTKRKMKKEILFSLQWGYAKNIDCYDEFKGVLENGLFPKTLLSVIEKTNDTVLWRFRFHPVHYRNKKKYRDLFSLVEKLVKEYPNCEWQESTYKPLPSILVCCSGHITLSSMSSYEAAYLGIETLALCPTLRDSGVNSNLFENLVSAGYLIKKEPSEQLIFKWQQAVRPKKPCLI